MDFIDQTSFMTSKEELIQWQTGVEQFQQGQYEEALDTFMHMQDSAKIAFNLGVILNKLERHAEAVSMLTHSIENDRYMGAAYFQRGYARFLNGEYGLAWSDYNVAHDLLRDNEYIDYTQLGLTFHMYRSEVLFNRAMAKEQLGQHDGAVEDIQLAQKYCREGPQKEIIMNAARQGLKNEITLFSIPNNILFEPRGNKVKNLERKHYLKDAKVVHSADGNKEYEGFTGTTLLQEATRLSQQSHDSQEDPQDTLTQLRKQQNFDDTTPQHRKSSTGSVYSFMSSSSASSFQRDDDGFSEFGTMRRGSRDSVAFNKIKIKVHFSDPETKRDKKVIILLDEYDLSVESVKSKVNEKLKPTLGNRPMHISYKDEPDSNELIDVLDDEDVHLAAEMGQLFITV